jgi:hypothetical protein
MSNGQEKKSIRVILDEYKDELQKELAQTDATKDFAKDIEDMVKEYEGISDIVAKYQDAHQNAFKEEKCKAQKLWEDEAKEWGKVLDDNKDLKNTIKNLAKHYDNKADSAKSDMDAARDAFNSIESNLDKARSEESYALNVFNKSKGFENKAKEYFTDFKKLVEDGKKYNDVGNLKLVYALFLEIEVVWQNIQNLYDPSKFSPPSPAKTPEWLLRKLNDELREVIEKKRAKYLAHKERLQKEKAKNTAQEYFKYFVEDNNRRKEFIREAQDAEATSCCTGSSDQGAKVAA